MKQIKYYLGYSLLLIAAHCFANESLTTGVYLINSSGIDLMKCTLSLNVSEPPPIRLMKFNLPVDAIEHISSSFLKDTFQDINMDCTSLASTVSFSFSSKNYFYGFNGSVSPQSIFPTNKNTLFYTILPSVPPLLNILPVKLTVVDTSKDPVMIRTSEWGQSTFINNHSTGKGISLCIYAPNEDMLQRSYSVSLIPADPRKWKGVNFLDNIKINSVGLNCSSHLIEADLYDNIKSANAEVLFALEGVQSDSATISQKSKSNDGPNNNPNYNTISQTDKDKETVIKNIHICVGKGRCSDYIQPYPDQTHTIYVIYEPAKPPSRTHSLLQQSKQFWSSTEEVITKIINFFKEVVNVFI